MHCICIQKIKQQGSEFMVLKIESKYSGFGAFAQDANMPNQEAGSIDCRHLRPLQACHWLRQSVLVIALVRGA